MMAGNAKISRFNHTVRLVRTPGTAPLTDTAHSWHLLMCYPCSFPAAHRAWGTIPDGTSAALVAVRCLSVWPLGRQYFLLMGLEQGACVWHHQSLLILLKVNGYLPARVPARRARFPKGAAESGGVLFHRRGLLDE